MTVMTILPHFLIYLPYFSLFLIIHTQARRLSQIVLIKFHPDLLLTHLSTTFSVFIQQFHMNCFSQRSHSLCACRGCNFCSIKKANLNCKHLFSFVSTCSIASTCRFIHIDCNTGQKANSSCLAESLSKAWEY